MTLYIKYKFYIPVHEIFNVQCLYQESLITDHRPLSLSNTQQSLCRSEVNSALKVGDDFIHVSLLG